MDGWFWEFLLPDEYIALSRWRFRNQMDQNSYPIYTCQGKEKMAMIDHMIRSEDIQVRKSVHSNAYLTSVQENLRSLTV